MTHPPFYVAGSFAAHPMQEASWRQSTSNLEVGKSRRVSSVASLLSRLRARRDSTKLGLAQRKMHPGSTWGL